MLSSVLKKLSASARFAVEGAIAALCVILSVALPQLAHALGGASAGAIWMPMYLAPTLAGCLLGWRWGLMVGALSPIASYAFTTLTLGAAMPALTRVPYMTAELAAFGAISGAFKKPIAKNALFAFPATLCAQIGGRAIYVIYSLIAGGSFSSIVTSIKTGLAGLGIQLLLVPLAVIVIAALIKEDKN